LFDITITGGTEKEIKETLKKFGRTPRGPFVRAHDERTAIKIQTPRIAATETATLFKTLEDQIIGSMGFPSGWIGEGQANRASAMSMELPTLQTLKAKQKEVGDFFRTLLDYQVLVLKRLGKVSPNAEYKLNMPSITQKNLVTIGQALNTCVPNLEKAVQFGWIDPEDAGKIVREVASGYGVELQTPPEPPVDLRNTSGVQNDSNHNNNSDLAVHDYIGLDNPEETREEKDERDLAKTLATGH